MTILLFFTYGVFALDVKGPNLKAQPNALKTVALIFFSEIIVLGQNLNFLIIRYVETKLFIKKKSAKIKPKERMKNDCTNPMQNVTLSEDMVYLLFFKIF